MRRIAGLSALAMGLWLAAGAPAEASCTGPGCTCSVSTSPFNFGNYNPIDPGALDATGTLSVTCSSPVLEVAFSYEVQFGSGGGDQINREMTGGPWSLAYNLYTNAARTIIWGDGGSATGVVANAYVLSLIFSRTDNFPIYGRIPARQFVGAAAYSDAIVATVIY